jgi:secreted PhoX family phosphatase
MSQKPEHFMDPDDLLNNSSANPTLQDVMAARLHRRHLLKGGVGALAAASLGSLGLTACGGSSSLAHESPLGALAFSAMPKDLADRLALPAGYTATVIYATGDSIDAAVPDYRNDGTDGNFARRSGDQHDGMHYFGLSADGKPAASSADRALMCINHESIAGTVMFMHANGQTNASSGARPEAEALKEVEAHGAAVVEIAKPGGKFALSKASAFNRRVTPRTPMAFSGPARGSALLKTKYAPDGAITRGMIGNCAGGYTPWGTYLTCEENFAGFFRRATGDDTLRTAKENTAFRRVGLNPGAGGNFRWTSVVPADASNTEYARWDASKSGASADGTDDFRNTHNSFGWVVEIDPYDPASTPVKRTGMGRFAHEGAWPSNPVAGKPLAFYMGDDSRSEYVYKFVSADNWDTADASRNDRLAVGAKYLDQGTLYAAKFNADGSGTWLKLDLSNPAVASGAAYTFTDIADVLVNARLAADAAGATKCDRPEWTAVNPSNGEVYITMTENPDRGNVGSTSGNNVPNPDVEPAFPRYWLDNKGVSTQNASPSTLKGNVNGQVMRLRETASDAAATTFNWDIYLFGAQAKADAGLDDANDFSKPDGCWFSRASGMLWIQTDDNAYTDVTNCMLLAAIPGTLGDGGRTRNDGGIVGL